MMIPLGLISLSDKVWYRKKGLRNQKILTAGHHLLLISKAWHEALVIPRSSS
jgi:hypothetical protein